MITSIMDVDEINQHIDSLARRLDIRRENNKISRIAEKVKESRGMNNVDPDTKRKEKTLTNQELANTVAPLEQDLDDRYVRLDSDAVRELDAELKTLRQDLQNLLEEANNIDIDELSDSVTRAKNSIASAEDSFSYCTLTHHGEPVYNKYLNRRGSDVKVDKNQVDDLVESIDKILDECRRASSTLRETKFPKSETIREEARETRSKRMEREMEEMKPYLSLGQIKRHFNIGEEFTAKDLADKVDSWSESTGLSVIEDALDAESTSDTAELDQVSENTYILKK